MSETPNDNFLQDRANTFDIILSRIDAHIAALAPQLILDIHAASPSSTRTAAEREAWTLLKNGVRHLKEGAPNGMPGSMSVALSKTSLRNCALAASLGVKPPQFENMYFNADYSSGFEAAVFLAARLADAAAGDISKSSQILRQKILQNAANAFNTPELLRDPELRRLFDDVQKSSEQKFILPEQDGVNEDEVQSVKKQMIMTFELLLVSFRDCCADFRNELQQLAPPPPAPRAPNKPFRI